MENQKEIESEPKTELQNWVIDQKECDLSIYSFDKADKINRISMPVVPKGIVIKKLMHDEEQTEYFENEREAEIKEKSK